MTRVYTSRAGPNRIATALRSPSTRCIGRVLRCRGGSGCGTRPGGWRGRGDRDARFDGVFFTAVRTTGIYCR
ncbi:Ada metal-binding domain-containing protein, partial [Kitasatospora cineracea]|uniref:Ada metal-binding domain-containing protein n=1 Tax=Kitasatospora cineracea TaxID=88074 RepID=UPI003410DDF9